MNNMKSLAMSLTMATGVAFQKEKSQLERMIQKMGWNNAAAMLKKIREQHNCTLVEAVQKYNLE